MITTRADLLPELKAILAKLGDLPDYRDVAEKTVYHEIEEYEGDVFCPEAIAAEIHRDKVALDLLLVIEWLEQNQ